MLSCCVYPHFRSAVVEYQLGLAHERGTDGKAPSWKEAFVHYSKAMELGNDLATYKVALCYEQVSTRSNGTATKPNRCWQ